MGKKTKKERDGYKQDVSRSVTVESGKFKRSFKHHYNSDSQAPVIRKQVEPETAKYFSDIANLFESQGVIVVNPFDLMCNCYGSHVLRSFLCLCKGIPLDSSEFHGTMGSKVLAERLNFKVSHLDGSDFQQFQRGFPNLLKLLVFGMVNCTREDMKSLLVDQYSSLVLQACLCFLLLFNLISFVSVVSVKQKQSVCDSVALWLLALVTSLVR
ncbi:hypothetical protein GQ457_03G040540 [Hibiscus cannabinus]